MDEVKSELTNIHILFNSLQSVTVWRLLASRIGAIGEVCKHKKKKTRMKSYPIICFFKFGAAKLLSLKWELFIT